VIRTAKKRHVAFPARGGNMPGCRVCQFILKKVNRPEIDRAQKDELLGDDVVSEEKNKSRWGNGHFQKLAEDGSSVGRISLLVWEKWATGVQPRRGTKFYKNEKHPWGKRLTPGKETHGRSFTALIRKIGGELRVEYSTLFMGDGHRQMSSGLWLVK